MGLEKRQSLKGLLATKYTSNPREQSLFDRIRALGYVAGLGLLDSFDTATGRRDELTPPRRIRRFIGNGDFVRVGRAIARYLVEELELEPGQDVLDVGCGAGRLAMPLTSVLDTGHYLGFDIVEHAIRWCQRTVTPRYPNFRFAHLDVRQEIYNPDGALTADSVRFPAPDASFDVAAMVGVINCLRPPEVENYLSEAARVLRPGGRCVVTAYLIDDEVADRVRAGETAFTFTHDHGDYFMHSPDEPTYAMAYRLDYVTRVAGEHGLVATTPPRPGSWSRTTARPASQDILVLTRTRDDG